MNFNQPVKTTNCCSANTKMSNTRVVDSPAVIGSRPASPGINNRASGSVDEVFCGSISRWQDARSVAALRSRAERLQSPTVVCLSVKPRGAGRLSSASKLSLTPVAHDTHTHTHSDSLQTPKRVHFDRSKLCHCMCV